MTTDETTNQTNTTNATNATKDAGDTETNGLDDGLDDGLDNEQLDLAAAADFETTVGEEPPQPVFAEVTDFVEGFLAPVFGRDVRHGQELTWCPEWWRHPEAVYRLESLWRSWEQLRLDAALGSSTWLRDHLDHHLPVLLSARGPFHGCSVDRGHMERDHTLPVLSPYDTPVSPDPVTPDPGPATAGFVP